MFDILVFATIAVFILLIIFPVLLFISLALYHLGILLYMIYFKIKS
jgi:hypothetical protein